MSNRRSIENARVIVMRNEEFFAAFRDMEIAEAFVEVAKKLNYNVGWEIAPLQCRINFEQIG